MKKALLLCVLCSGAWFSLPAQFSLSVHAGANVSRFSFSKESRDMFSPLDFRAGYHAGITPAIKGKANRLELAVPLQYTARTYNVSTPPPLPGFSAIENDRLHYVEIAPQLGYYITPGLIFSAGGYISGLLAAQHDFEGKWQAYSQPVKNDIFEAIDYGIVSGARVHIRRFFLYGGAQVGFAPIRYSFTLIDINGDPIFTAKRRNLNFQFGAGYVLMENKK